MDWQTYPLLAEDLIWLAQLQVGDPVCRLLAGVSPMHLKVSAITGDRIVCGLWEFSRLTGGEIDEDLGWDAHTTGSFIRKPTQRTES